LVTLERLRKYGMEIDQVVPRGGVTTHTPLEAAFDKFSYDLVQQVLGQEFPLEVMKEVGGEDKLNMTLLALNLSGYQNGVTKAHSQQSLKIFPHYAIRAITNGVHSNTWTSPSFHQLFDKYVPGWASEPEMLVRIAQVPLCDTGDAHMKNPKPGLRYTGADRRELMNPVTLGLQTGRVISG
jgi:starch phosphorylase